MKILKLRFKNLNSLYGEWEIDFTAPDYVSNGIFAITGPTGAGKSTIMDAICLALYGATPRLGKITASGNEIMSRQTGECFAEVTFESQAGRFRCHWGQHRARKQTDGRLAEARHEIAEADTGKILESKKRDVAMVIEAKTGMDFDRFTRSILLAQGSFAAFLKAAPDERAPVLEQITGTEIYSTISQRVHERARDEHNQLDLLQAETAGLTILSDDDEAALKTELGQLTDSERKLTLEQEMLTRAIQWLDGLDHLRAEMTELDGELAEAKLAQELFKPDRQRLQQACKAAELEGEFAALTAQRKQQQSDLQGRQDNQNQLNQADDAFIKATEQLDLAMSATAAAKSEQLALAPLIRQIRLLDQQIEDKKSAISVQQSECRNDATAITTQQQIHDAAEEQQAKLSAERLEIEEYLAQHAADESLVSQLAGITEQMNQLHRTAVELNQRQNQLAAQQKLVGLADGELDALTKSSAASLQAETQAQQNLAAGKLAHEEFLGGRLLREYEAERDGLLREMAYLKKIASLEAERKKLEDGKPCPLCGAVEHPFAAGNVPEADDTEKQIQQLTALIGQANQQLDQIKVFEGQVQTAAAKVAAAGKLLALAEQKQTTAATELQRLEGEVQLVAARCNQLQESLRSTVKPFGIGDFQAENITSAQAILNSRLAAWQDHQQKKAGIEQKAGFLATEIKQADAIINTLTLSLNAKQATLTGLTEALVTLTKQRSELFGIKNSDVEEQRLVQQITAAEASEKQVRAVCEQCKELVSSIKTRLATLETSLQNRQPLLQKLEQDFIESLTQADFADEQLFLDKRLSPVERDSLGQRALAVDGQLATVQTRKMDREARLAQELAKQVTDVPRENLQQNLDVYQEALRQIGEEIGAKKQKLKDNSEARNKLQDKQSLIDNQKMECERWDKLRELIGSADGKKYRNFAQGLTFELMVNHANRQLEKMTDRYLLTRDEVQPLELNVVDNYQAGEIRSTKNLSGGESFIVSLALALGLSKMASRKVRVDSLFLDEGFGTLDEEALETALETLAGLQQDGKLIGVISHVSALKERIGTQLKIWPQSGGKSTITGPGVSLI